MRHHLKVALACLALCVVPLEIPSTEYVAENDSERDTSGFWGCTSDPCVIQYNPGGWVRQYVEAADALRHRGNKLVIDGKCISACAIMADFARPNVCLTDKAEFWFHMASREFALTNGIVAIEYSEPPTSPDIRNWVKSKGGFPIHSFVKMSYAEARKFWPDCRFPKKQ